MTSLNIESIDSMAATASESTKMQAPPNSPTTTRDKVTFRRPRVLSPLAEDEKYLSLSLLRRFHHVLDGSEDDMSVAASPPCSPRVNVELENSGANPSGLAQLWKEKLKVKSAVDEAYERLDKDVMENERDVENTTFPPDSPRQVLDHDERWEAVPFASTFDELQRASPRPKHIYDDEEMESDDEEEGVELVPESYQTPEGQGTFRERTDSEYITPPTPQYWLHDRFCETKEDLDDLYEYEKDPYQYLKDVKRTLFL